MSALELAAGDTIRELDDRGRFVQLWLVVMVNLTPTGTVPHKARAAGRPRVAVEPWPSDRPWERSHFNHHFAMPPAL